MKLDRKNSTRWTAIATFLLATAVGFSARAAMPDMLKLTGDQEVPPVKTTDTVGSVPQDAKLSAEQLAGYRAGRLYVNVHTEANKGGEIRAQLAP